MAQEEVILRFNTVSFGYGHQKPIVHEASFSVRRGAKITLMGQNGAGKSTIFKLITGALSPEEGTIAIPKGLTIATARQVMPRDELDLTVRAFFERAFSQKVYDLDPRIEKALDVVHLSASLTKKIKEFSGGQQARLLLAFALIQDPDLLLLDEPTNNLDKAGIAHLTKFLIEYKKTCMVISHDAHFLNAFTEGVLYLDVFTRAVDQYTGNYFTLVEEIARRIERERRENVRLEKEIIHRKEQANFFAQKGGHMRDVARKMKEKIEELEEGKVETREEDRTIRQFMIPCQAEIDSEIGHITGIPVLHGKKPVTKKVKIVLKKKLHILLAGPNGVGKTSFLESLATDKAKNATIASGIRVGYYRQDFSTLNFEHTTYQSLLEVAGGATEERVRSLAAGFLLTADVLKTRVAELSEGQKGLLSFARIVLQEPGLLLIDEPTNHMNFRHIPVIAKALDRYEGALILVSHVPDFVKQIRIDETVDLETI